MAAFRTRTEQSARQEARQEPVKAKRDVIIRRLADDATRKPVDDWHDRREQRQQEEAERLHERAYWAMIKYAFHRHHPDWKREPGKSYARLHPYWDYRFGTFNGGRPEDQWAEPDQVLLDTVLGIYMDEIRIEDARQEADRERQAAAEGAARKAGAQAARVQAEEALTAKLRAVEGARTKATEALMAKVNA